MRPDLFAGPALRDDRYRILARLANGGSVPAAARHWIRWNPTQRARLAAVATLLATGAAAWVWLQNGESPAAEPIVRAVRPGVPPPPAAQAEAAPQQAATIINAVMPPTAPANAPPALAPHAAIGTTPALAAARPVDSRPAHRRPGKSAALSRKQEGASTATESDEDVTLLAAMLKHAKPQKPSPMPPKD